ncbi:MAG: HD domain-containing protein [Mangrovicoccus sp.]
MSDEVLKLARALVFAAEAHANQRRKGAAQEPYINHLIEVMDLVGRATDGTDIDLMIGALLHDVVEDTKFTRADVAEQFGDRVADLVVANSDDMSLPKPERKRQRIANMPHKTSDARMVKTADVISNVRAMVISAPAGWTADWKLGYLKGCCELIEAGKGANETLESWFSETAAEAERAIKDDSSMMIEGRESVVRHLESKIGEPVHKVYLPNTDCRELGRPDVERLARLAATCFPSVTIETGDAIFDGQLRQILVARMRTDDRDSVVAFAQRLCLEFEQDFVGIEVSGRYIRVYSDDTG